MLARSSDATQQEAWQQRSALFAASEIQERYRVGTLSSKDKRLRGSAGVKQRARRLEAEPLCRMCKADGIVRLATVPDHIIPLAKGGTDDDSNIRCLCADHHDQVTREEFGHRKRVTIGQDGWPCD